MTCSRCNNTGLTYMGNGQRCHCPAGQNAAISRHSYGRLSGIQRELLRPFVVGRTVHDLGAGSGALSLILLELGAKHVVAIDKELTPIDHPKITNVECYLDEYSSHDPIDTAFVSWPANYTVPGLSFLMGCAKRVIYLGKNTDGSNCATRHVMSRLLCRPVLAHAPEKPNTVTVYGEDQGKAVARPLTGEEFASLYSFAMLSFEEAEEKAKKHDHLSPRGARS